MISSKDEVSFTVLPWFLIKTWTLKLHEESFGKIKLKMLLLTITSIICHQTCQDVALFIEFDVSAERIFRRESF